VAGPGVQGKVTVSLREVTLQEALETILLANGLNFVTLGNVIVVKPVSTSIPGERRARLYRLNYINASQLKEAIADLLSDGAVVKVLSPQFAEVGNTGPQQEAQLSGMERSSMLLVSDRPEVLRQIDALVKKLDVPTPQVMIEARLVELSPTDQKSLGIDWDKTISATLMYEQTLPSGRVQTYSALKESPLGEGKWRFGHLTAAEFSAVLEFLKSHTESKLISNPKILAMDNQEAVISVGTTVPIPQINRGVGGQGDIVTFTYKDVNIELRVTPHVSEGDLILMSVRPVIEEITGEVVVDANRAPITSKRSIQTVVAVRDGETVVIGGMIKEKKIKTQKKVWLLGDIPLLGHLFTHETSEVRQSDLLIFITPHIVREKRALRQP